MQYLTASGTRTAPALMLPAVPTRLPWCCPHTPGKAAAAPTRLPWCPAQLTVLLSVRRAVRPASCCWVSSSSDASSFLRASPAAATSDREAACACAEDSSAAGKQPCRDCARARHKQHRQAGAEAVKGSSKLSCQQTQQNSATQLIQKALHWTCCIKKSA